MGRPVAKSYPWSAILILASAFAHPSCTAADDWPEAVVKELEAIEKSRGIEIVTGDPGFPVKTLHGKIDGRVADRKDLRAYVRIFAPEFSLYPPSFVKRARLKRVVLCGDLAFAGQRRNAIPDYEHDTLYLDVARGAYDKTYLRKVIHHEFFHVVDYRDDGLVYEDLRWKTLNPPKFRYGPGGRFAQDSPTTSLLTEDQSGFLNHYSTTGVEEDKAELFANLIVEPAYVEGRAKKDPVLEAKVARMKRLLADFCPEMSDKFWEAVRTPKKMGD